MVKFSGSLQAATAAVATAVTAYYSFKRIQKYRTASKCESAGITVAIIGTGFSGIAAAYHLDKAGVKYVMYEKADEIGGTWNFNRYPGAACDIESFLYQLSFYMKTNWSSNYPSRDEILDYLRDAFVTLGIHDKVKFNHEFLGAEWDEKSKSWKLSMHANGSEFTAQHKFVVNATGPLHLPLLPTGIPGYGAFAGPAFHSAEWPVEGLAAVKGLRVGIIGSAASAAQIVPAIAPHVAHLTVFQRTPTWVAPRRELPFGRLGKFLLAVPGVAAAYRFALWVRHEATFAAFRDPNGLFARIAKRDLSRSMARQLQQPALREALIPKYSMGCKRVILSNLYLRAFNRDNVTLVTAPIAGITATGVSVRVGDATDAHDLDVLVYATGFQVMSQHQPTVANVRGTDGQPLAVRWADYPKAYRGVVSAHLPNWFHMLGPYSGLGHNSVIVMLEAQARYIARIMRVFTAPVTLSDWSIALRSPTTVGVTQAVEASWVDWCDAKHESAVWKAGGCVSWYKTASGHVVAVWPLSTQRYMFSMAIAGLRGLTFA